MDAANQIVHVLNRGNARQTVFPADDDYREFLALMAETAPAHGVSLLGWCLMPNHFHLVVRARADGGLGRWMQQLMTAQVRRHRARHGGSGHLWQGRFKAFPVQADAHYVSVLRYVERNALRARLVRRAEAWPWSSLAARLGDAGARRSGGSAPLRPAESPVPLPEDWPVRVNAAETMAELEAIRRSVQRGAPYGGEAWVARAAARLGLEHTLRPRGRPRTRPAADEDPSGARAP
jgi:putative transposase